MGKSQKPQTGAAPQVAAPAPDPAPRQSADTAAEAGLPQVLPTPEPVVEAPTPDPIPEPAFDSEAYADFLSELKLDDFEAALEATLSEAYLRGIVVAGPEEESDEDELEPQAPEVEQADEHAPTRELLQRYQLEKAFVVAGITYFDENAARMAAGGDADSITEISPV